MRTLQYIFLVLCAATMAACGSLEVQEPGVCGGTEVVLRISGDGTRTAVNPDGLSVRWELGDRIAVWASRPDGSWQFAGQEFVMVSRDGSDALFTSTLAEAMPAGEYFYYAVYPVPEAADGTTLTFNIPSEQDGTASGGCDVMMAGPVTGGELGTLREEKGDFSLHMRHLVHLLKFYLPSGCGLLDGEEVGDISITLPGSKACGRFSVELGDPSSVAGGERGDILIRPDGGLPVSGEGVMRYACAAVIPGSYGSGDEMQVKLYSPGKVAKMKFPLEGRTLAAGHATPVAMRTGEVSDISTLVFSLSGNNLGEPVQKITVATPSDTYSYTPDGDMETGDSFAVRFEDRGQFTALSGAELTVTCESEHAITRQKVTVPPLASVKYAEIAVTVPYLLYEDFSGVGSFSSDDGYSTSSTGSKNAISFLNGWTGGRVGAQAGNCIRIAPRRETSARYHARVDSAPIAEIKSPVDVKVEFDYGYNNEFSTFKLFGKVVSKGDYPMDAYIGYVADSAAYKSGDETGIFEGPANSFNTGTAKNADWQTPRHAAYVISNMPSGTSNRITWRGEVENHAGADNTTCWLYIDNVKVTISK